MSQPDASRRPYQEELLTSEQAKKTNTKQNNRHNQYIPEGGRERGRKERREKEGGKEGEEREGRKEEKE